MDKIQLPAKIRYEYQEDRNMPVQYVHGVWGGINPQGEIEVNFYAEQDKIPEYAERYLKPDGSYGAELTMVEEDMRVVVRKIQAKVLLNHQTAKALYHWLGEKVEALEAEELRSFEMLHGKKSREQ